MYACDVSKHSTKKKNKGKQELEYEKLENFPSKYWNIENLVLIKSGGITSDMLT